ncbi:ABC transporter permease [Leeia sp.]|uniref:ABC transporter permease n=1 Tax=Leeia sp. TaxID=2884678 RepID=UPI0035B060BC
MMRERSKLARLIMRTGQGGLSIGLTLLGLLLVTFLIARVAPIDPVLKVVGDKASKETYEAVRREMGLDQSLPVQFARYLKSVVSGELGTSTSTGQPVMDDLLRYFPATLELSTIAILLGVLLGIPLGIWAACRHNRWQDQLIRAVSLLGYSVPVFWLGLVALLVFYAKLGWVSGPGRLDDVYQYTIESWSHFALIDTLRSGDMSAFGNALSHLVLPASLLAYFSLAYIARMTRAYVLEELSKEYVTLARVKGASEWRILWRHVLPNLRGPLLTVSALSYAVLLEGAVLTESVFSWPGIGLYITNALFSADMSAVLGGTLLIGICFVLLNSLTDTLSRMLDPRTR